MAGAEDEVIRLIDLALVVATGEQQTMLRYLLGMAREEASLQRVAECKSGNQTRILDSAVRYSNVLVPKVWSRPRLLTSFASDAAIADDEEDCEG